MSQPTSQPFVLLSYLQTSDSASCRTSCKARLAIAIVVRPPSNPPPARLQGRLQRGTPTRGVTHIQSCPAIQARTHRWATGGRDRPPRSYVACGTSCRAARRIHSRYGRARLWRREKRSGRSSRRALEREMKKVSIGHVVRLGRVARGVVWRVAYVCGSLLWYSLSWIGVVTINWRAYHTHQCNRKGSTATQHFHRAEWCPGQQHRSDSTYHMLLSETGRRHVC